MTRRRPAPGPAVVLLIGIVLALLAGPAAARPVGGDGGYVPFTRPGPERLTHPWTHPLPPSVRLDAASTAIVAHLTSEVPVANLYEYAVPIFEADGRTPRHQVRCTAPWGRCALEDETVPIPDGAVPAPGSDGAMVVVDREAGRSYEFWQARQEGGRWVTSWGGVVDLGVLGDPESTPPDLPTGAGVSRLAGVVRTHEIAGGRIPHALVFSTDNACEGAFRSPARKSDGRSTAPDCIPEGARVRLDPSVRLGDLDLTPAELAVGRALQRYGAYAIDNGGAPMAIVFEHPAGEPDPYPDAGLRWDFQALDGLPWEHLQVLASWDGS